MHIGKRTFLSLSLIPWIVLCCTDEAARTRAVNDESDRAAIASLLSEHKAIADLTGLFEGHDSTSPFHNPFSVEIDDALARLGKTPILFVGALTDIERIDSRECLAHFSELQFDDDGNYGYWFEADLLCTQEQTDSLVRASQRADAYAGGFVVVAAIDDVMKPKIELGIAVDESDPYSSEVVFDVPQVYVIRGKLLETKPIYNIYSSLHSPAD
jgi:hypothetical protein